jgi:hypothetical protein
MKTKRRYERVDWDDPKNITALHVVVREFAFDGPTLARMTGLSVGQVYYRLQRYGVSLRDLRKGEYGYGAEVMKEYTLTNKKARIHVPEMKATWQEFENKRIGVANGKKKKQKTA